jgi:hypothetical protein
VRINSNLNLVFPVDTASNGTVYVHATPLSREVFERYFLVISRTFTAIYAEGLQIMGGPRVAALMLKKVAEERGEWDGPDGVRDGLMAEIRRLMNVAVVGPEGWKSLPYHTARRDGTIDDDDAAEVEGIVCFFISASAMHLRSQLPSILSGVSSLWGAQTTSSNSTEYAASLPISTEIDPSNAIQPEVSSVPS